MLKISSLNKTLNKQLINIAIERLVSLRWHSGGPAPATQVDKYQELSKMVKRPLYLDSLATSPVDPRVLDAMLPYMTNMFGNPHSRTHAYGWESEKAVEEAREVSSYLFIIALIKII
jgi:selenocysteine lyase/cysteine desulfurase